MPKPKNYFEQLAGVPVHYDRTPNNPAIGYGTRGKPYKFYCDDAFRKKLDAFFGELWAVCPLGRADLITSGGAYVDFPGKTGLHPKGRAFDLDGIFWPARTFIALRYKEDPPFYLAIDALLRMYFAQVLDYFFPAHQDHFHADDGPVMGFNQSSEAECGFVAAALREVFGFRVPQTNQYEPLRDSLHKLNAGDLRKLPTWRAFLYRVVINGFASVG